MASCNIIMKSSINDLLGKAPGYGFCFLHSVLIAVEHETIDIKVSMNKI